jgi:hypothetical protein
VLEVDDVLVPASHVHGSRAKRYAPAEPIGQGVVIRCRRAVGQRDLGGAVITQACGSEEKLRNAPRGQPEPGPEVVDREAAVALDALDGERRRIEPLAEQRLDGIPPELDDLNGG